jgi:mono/diheme cytochrome c family protein
MRAARIAALAACLTTLGCEPAEQWPAAYPESRYLRSQLGLGEPTPFEPKPELQKGISEFLAERFGSPADPKIKSATAERNREIKLGSRVFRQQCMYCHGLSGNGEGSAAAAFDPRPRDYRRGIFKWKSTLGPDRPLREDLIRTVAHGVPGTSMPSFKMLPEESLRQVVEYVVFLSQRGEVEFRLLVQSAAAPDSADEMKDFLEEFADAKEDALKRVLKAWESAKPVTPPPAPVYDSGSASELEAAILRGRDVFVGPVANCVKCHGLDGKGRRQLVPGEKVTDDKDVWGRIANPRDLTDGEYRGGRSAADLYRRVHQGILASSMPAFEKNLKPNEIWDVVQFVRALPYRPDLLPAASQAKPPGAANPKGQ